MTSLTFTQARDDILGIIKTAWDTTGYNMIYQDQKGGPPSDETPWGRTTIQHNEGGQQSLTGGLGTVRYERSGIIIVQIFTPSGEGLSSSDNLAKIVIDAFEGKTSPNGIWFRNARLNEIGPDGNWFQVNIIIDFEYDEIK